MAILNELEDGGLAERRRDPADRRRHMVEVTEAGAAALGWVDAAVGEAERELFGGLTEAEQTLLRGLLDRVVVNPADHECGEWKVRRNKSGGTSPAEQSPAEQSAAESGELR
ncbi:hypothetical protein AB0F57_05290 [Streptomyces tanashiensis]|uniref:hypothetical protein n=1 Tax=Streptomyces tanashiensis TaxID=67367 RepID=UPI0033E34577